MISAEVKQHSTYVVKKQAPEPAAQATQASQAQPSQLDPDFVAPDEPMLDVAEEEAEEEYVAKEDIVKAWRFGSTWVPMEVDMFEPLITNKGVEILNFIPTEHASVTMPLPDVVADQNRSSVITS
jgi:ATP-dependent DNA helicase 2 subunit 2